MKNDNFSDEMDYINSPQFMGQQLGGASIEKVRALIKRQKRLKGFSHNAPIGTSTLNIDLSGTARIFLGIALFGISKDATLNGTFGSFVNVNDIQFTINNEIVLDQLSPNFLTPQFNNNEYYYIPRPLSGTDTITMNFNNTGLATEVVKVVIYYI